jgi:hypothetical protein
MMAGFCKTCSVDLFGEDFGDLADLTTKEEAARGEYRCALCETCGFITVDPEGLRVGVVLDYPLGAK